MIGETRTKCGHMQNPVHEDEKEASSTCKKGINLIHCIIYHCKFCPVPDIFFLIYVDDMVKILEEKSNDPQMKSVVLFGFDVRQDDIDSLQPRELITDTILSIMIRYLLYIQ